ncbi:cytochrome P450 [Fomitopsis serialis]|uniref:cytochrome P450 n=1 Tax=Fomitopsis serialis TaxID=139415 RepID=UPI0020088DD4|nr:cytochrome P450 [Neoantrodia serialis]KAH9923589.1 cytochrome P450 [Neoantrodia serialis]
MWATVLLVFAVLLATQTVQFFLNLKKVSYLPGFRTVFSQFSVFGAAIPTNYFHPGLNWIWEWRQSVYKYYGTRTISYVPFIGEPVIWTSSMEVAKQLLAGDSRLIKAPSALVPLLLWGDSVLTANHEAYKKHRRVVGPAFSSNTYALVARETVRWYHEMVEGENWIKQGTFTIESLEQSMLKFTLGVLSRTSFNYRYPWATSGDSSGVPFERALTTILTMKDVIIRLATPNWAYKLPIERIRRVDDAYRKLGALMRSFVTSKKEELASTTEDMEPLRSDLLTRLVSASEAEGKNGLDDSEVIGNVFSFLFAGHETTAHTVAAALALLALHEDEQEKAVKAIHEALPDGRDPTFDDFAKLEKVLACFHEAGRMFPGGAIVTRDTIDTFVLKVPDERGDEKTLVVPPNMRIMIDMVGVHYDPRLYPDPERYDPSRWYGVTQETDFTYFGLGPRACLGRKFALVVAMSLMTSLLRDWKFTVPLKLGETKEQWRERIMQGKYAGLGFGVHHIPVKMTRRVKA